MCLKLSLKNRLKYIQGSGQPAQRLAQYNNDINLEIFIYVFKFITYQFLLINLNIFNQKNSIMQAQDNPVDRAIIIATNE